MMLGSAGHRRLSGRRHSNPLFHYFPIAYRCGFRLNRICVSGLEKM